MHGCMHTCGYACACRHAHIIHMWVCVSMVRCGWMAHHTCGHVCTCACVVLMVPVSGFLCRCLACTHACTSGSICLGFLCRCLGCLGAPRAHGMGHTWGERLLGWCLVCCGSVDHACMCATRACRAHVHTLEGACSHAHIHRREAPAGRVPHGLWIMHACAPHIHTHMQTTYACAWHAHSCCMLITCTHTHTHTHTYMHVWTCIHVLLHAHHIHTHTCIHAYMCNTPRNHTACGCCMHIHLELFNGGITRFKHNAIPLE